MLQSMNARVQAAYQLPRAADALWTVSLTRSVLSRLDSLQPGLPRPAFPEAFPSCSAMTDTRLQQRCTAATAVHRLVRALVH